VPREPRGSFFIGGEKMAKSYKYINPQTGKTITVSESMKSQMEKNAAAQGVDVSSRFKPSGTMKSDPTVSSSKNSDYGSTWGNTTGQADTSVLSGYAKNYANAINSGKTDLQAHDIASNSTKNWNQGALLKQQTPFSNLSNEEKMNIINQSAAQAVAQNKPQIDTNVFEGAWQKFMDWAQPYMQKPETQVPTYENISEEIRQQLAPIHEVNLGNLKMSRDQALKAIADNLAARGVYNSDINEEKSAELLNKYGNAEALANAQFENDIANYAQGIYRERVARAEQAEQQYNQGMINLGLAMLNGMIDTTRFLMDDAYRQAVLSRSFAGDVLSNFGNAG